MHIKWFRTIPLYQSLKRRHSRLATNTRTPKAIPKRELEYVEYEEIDEDEDDEEWDED